MAQQNADLAAASRDFYRAEFRRDLLAGTKKPFLLPLHLFGLWILPTLYLAIPHKDRPWIYRARWLVLAFAVAFNFNLILHVGSENFTCAYGTGLIGAWGIVLNLTLLVWTKPQWEAKRVDIRRKRKLEDVKSAQGNELEERSSSAKTTGVELNGHSRNGHLSRSLKERHHTDTTDLFRKLADIPEEARNALLDAVPSLRQNENGVQALADLEKLADEQEFEYYWQEYPTDASFWTRLDWAFDIVSTFRMTGWNWAISCLPPYELPPKIGNYQLPLNAVGPHRTKQGFTRPLSRKAIFFSRFFLEIIPCYLLIDFCAVHMTADPYFVLGPEHNQPLPPHLATLSPLRLSLQRTAFSFFAVTSALYSAFGAGALVIAFVPPFPQLLGFRAHPWHLPSTAGSFLRVLDRGLAGFWGEFWHQTFRFGFSAPSQWLQRHGYVTPGTLGAHVVTAFCAFVISGFLHACGSYSTLPSHTKPWLPPLFFVFAALGTSLQSAVCHAAIVRPHIQRLPRWLRRLGNLLFVLAWMWVTSWAFLDDLARCGLWLLEPVPVSVFRALGVGPTQDRRVWRAESEVVPRWYRGEHWWETGIAV